MKRIPFFSELGRVGLLVAFCGVYVGSNVFASDSRSAQPPTLSLHAFSKLLLEHNRRAVAARAQTDIAQTNLNKALAQHQAQVRFDVATGEQNDVNSPEDALTRGKEWGQYRRTYDNISSEVSALLPFGATLTGRTSLSRFWTSSFGLLGDPATAYRNRFRSLYDVTLSQPLLKDNGSDITRTPISLAELDHQMSDLSRRDSEILVLGEGVNVFYDLVVSHHRATAAGRKVDMGRQLLDTARALHLNGRLDVSALADVEISTVQFEASLFQANEVQRDLSNRAMKALQLEQLAVQGVLPVALELPETPVKAAPIDRLVEEALDQRSDLKAKQIAVDREEVALRFHRNQMQPRLDAKLNYGYSGLALGPGSSFDHMYRASGPTFSVGVMFQSALGVDKAMEANLAAARIRQQLAAQERDALKLEIRRDIDTAASMVNGAAARWGLWRSALQREKDNLALQRERFESGRSDLRALLLVQERVINVELQLVEQRAAYARAQALLRITQGKLIENAQ